MVCTTEVVRTACDSEPAPTTRFGVSGAADSDGSERTGSDRSGAAGRFGEGDAHGHAGADIGWQAADADDDGVCRATAGTRLRQKRDVRDRTSHAYVVQRVDIDLHPLARRDSAHQELVHVGRLDL